MLNIMAFPDLEDKFVRALTGVVPLNQLYRKSGEYKVWYSDSMLVWSGWRRYILAAIIEAPPGGDYPAGAGAGGGTGHKTPGPLPVRQASLGRAPRALPGKLAGP